MSTSKNRRLAAILFADIVGYTTLMQNNEPQALTSLQKFKSSLKIEVPAHHGEIIQFYGDGCLCVFNSSVDAVACAKTVQSLFQREPKVPVRIGLHAGDIIFRDGNVFGDAVNIASRVESMGIPGSVLISSNVRNQIKNQPEFKLKNLGKFEFKNVQEGMTVYALANEGFALPKQGEIKGKLKSPTGKTNWVMPAIISAVLLLSVGIWKWNLSNTTTSSHQEKPTPITSSVAENSLAVLPFTNMSANAENQYFCEGMHDDLLTHLSKIGSMKVISRTSVLRFQETQLPIPEIAKMLEVANILEGSVRRAGNQLRINVQLIKAETDEHIWSEMYDRELTATNIFDIQTEIAQKIAAVLKTTITTLQQQALAELPTENLAAYEAYLKARQLAEKRNSVSLNQAKDLLEEAIQLDDSFALAYIDLGSIYMLLADYSEMDKQVSNSKARENLEKGMALNDNLAEAYALKGTILGYDEKNLEEAVEAFEKAIEINPNYATTYHWYALAIEKRSRDFDKAFSILKKGLRLNPLSPSILYNIGRYYQIQKEYSEAIKTYKKAISLEPAYPSSWNNLSMTYALLGQLDSSTIYSLKGVQQNQASDLYLDFYLADLLELEMDQEFRTEINNLQPKDRLDSLTILRYTYFFAETQNAFTSNLSLVNNTSLLDRPTKQAYNRRTFLYQKDFKQYIKNYEKEFAKVDTADELVALSGRDEFQEYIFSLKQEGQTTKAKTLWATYHNKGIEKDLGKLEYPGEERRRFFLNCRHYLIEGQPEKAIQMMHRYFAGGYCQGWHFFERDPIFDSLRSHPEFIEIMKEVTTKIARQRVSVRDYIKIKG